MRQENLSKQISDACTWTTETGPLEKPESPQLNCLNRVVKGDLGAELGVGVCGLLSQPLTSVQNKASIHP